MDMNFNVIGMKPDGSKISFENTLHNKTFGVVTLPTITDNANGTMTFGTDGVMNFATESEGKELFYRINVTNGATITPDDEAVSYIYVDYNAGNPIYAKSSSPSVFLTEATYCPVLRVIRDGNDLCILDYDNYGASLGNKMLYKDISVNGAVRQSGLVLSTEPTRISTVSAGQMWFGVNLTTASENKAGVSGIMKEFYLSAGVWNSGIVTEYDSLYYSDGTDRQTLSNNRWVSKYFFRSISNVSNCVSFVHGNEFVSKAGAVSEAVPIIPLTLQASSIYVGKIVIKKDETDGEAYPREWNGSISVSGAVNHNDLGNRDVAGNHTVITPLIDAEDSFRFTKADGVTNVMTVDTTNDNILDKDDIELINKKKSIAYSIALG